MAGEFGQNMTIGYAEFEASLDRGRFHANYFIFGADPFLVDSARNSLRQALEQAGPVVVVTLDLDEVSVDELINSAQSLSMFAPRQFLVVKSAMKLREHQGKRLAQYFANPNPQTVIAFLAGDLDRDQRKKKIFETLSAGTHVVELAPLNPGEVKEWIEQQAREKGCSIEPEAIRFLLELQGSDLGRLYQEVEKATLYSGTDATITLPVVQAVSGFAASHTLLEFLDAIVARNKARALELVEEVFFTGKETGLAFWWFGQQLRQWVQFRELAGKTPAAVIGRQAGVYRALAAQRMQEQAKRFSRRSLIRALQGLAVVDDKVKSSCVDTRFSMEMLVHDLTN
ncbi:MAG: DNA polymerase III subunit delta [Acidimicrobiia bacterium]|nr:DNA polymerase III subunit delta [Acidimicrobiia bacterium]